MNRQLIIVRHGNTFLPTQVPTRVGGRTDLPLVEQDKALSVANWLSKHDVIPDYIYAAPLLRTMQTAEIIRTALHIDKEVISHSDFVEIDYGPDENKTEDEVIHRLGSLFFEQMHCSCSDSEIVEKGRFILKAWDDKAIVPQGWKINVNKIIDDWIKFTESIPDNSTVLICSSNGIIRFAPHILKSKYSEFIENHNLKVATGSISLFSNDANDWVCDMWNYKPSSKTND